MKKGKSKKTDVELLTDELLGNDRETQAKDTAVNKVNIRQWIQDAPVSNESVLPRYYTFTKDHAIIRKNESDEDKSNFILPCPLFITGRAIDHKTKKETVQLKWIRDREWKSIEVERKYICKSNLLVGILNGKLATTTIPTAIKKEKEFNILAYNVLKKLSI